METCLHTTGIRRTELIHLKLTMLIFQAANKGSGKEDKERILPCLRQL
jgi:site-specific recombinase XerD